MNKSELVGAVAEKSGLSKTQAESAVDAFVASVIEAVNKKDKVSLIGFGSFVPTARGARKGRNPQTGAPVTIKASKSVRFSVGSQFKQILNGKATLKKASSAKKAAPKKAAPKKAAPKKAAVKKTAAKKTTAKKATKKR